MLATVLQQTSLARMQRCQLWNLLFTSKLCHNNETWHAGIFLASWLLASNEVHITGIYQTYYMEAESREDEFGVSFNDMQK
jgi:hypothetical protein